MQIAAKEVLSCAELNSEWARTLASLSKCSQFSESSRNSAGHALMLKMLHSQFKEFATNTRTLETIEEGKTTDVDVALRAKLKTHAAEKQLSA